MPSFPSFCSLASAICCVSSPNLYTRQVVLFSAVFSFTILDMALLRGLCTVGCWSAVSHVARSCNSARTCRPNRSNVGPALRAAKTFGDARFQSSNLLSQTRRAFGDGGRARAHSEEEAAAAAAAGAAAHGDDVGSTIFDRILSGDIPATVVYEDDKVLAFRDIRATAPVHVLLIPKRRDGLTQLSKAQERHKEMLGHLLYAAQLVAKQEGLVPGGFRIVINDGPDGSQSVYHLHLHILGGRQMTWPPG
eukprot:jgi/Mesen1/10879/ME000093S10395